jgi:dihydrofolate reductase
MRLSAIVAMSENRVIGVDNTLPWHLPADLQHFKKVTMGKPIVMGRKTYESIGRPLPGRCNIVMTRDITFQAPGCIVVHSMASALEAVPADSVEVFIIGGAELFETMLPSLQRLYVTIVHHDFTGDTYFPLLNMTEWQERECITHAPDDQNKYSYSFIMYDRV